jgi:hypothetical protein
MLIFYATVRVSELVKLGEQDCRFLLTCAKGKERLVPSVRRYLS